VRPQQQRIPSEAKRRPGEKAAFRISTDRATAGPIARPDQNSARFPRPQGPSKGDRPKTNKPKSWRDVLKIHPAAELFPMMSADELRELGEDIKKNNLHEGVALLDGMLLDGRNRLDAMEMAGIKLVTGNGQPEWANIPFRKVKGVESAA
jgi:hypothetical protein